MTVFKDNNGLSIFSIILAVIIISVIYLMVGGFIVKTLWNWVITSISGMAPISLYQGLGIFLILAFLAALFKTGASKK